MAEEEDSDVPLAEIFGGVIATGLIAYGLYTGNMVVFLTGAVAMTAIVTIRSFAREMNVDSQ